VLAQYEGKDTAYGMLMRGLRLLGNAVVCGVGQLTPGIFDYTDLLLDSFGDTGIRREGDIQNKYNFCNEYHHVSAENARTLRIWEIFGKSGPQDNMVVYTVSRASTSAPNIFANISCTYRADEFTDPYKICPDLWEVAKPAYEQYKREQEHKSLPGGDDDTNRGLLETAASDTACPGIARD
jgi:hypothetical protein